MKSHKLALSIIAMMPLDVKEAIVNDINSLSLGPLTVLEMRRSNEKALRVVATLFLRLIVAPQSGGVYVPGETRASSYSADLGVILLTSVIHYQAYEAGVQRGGEDRQGRPEVWQLAAQEKTDEAIHMLEQNPALIRQIHRGYTIAHQACLYGNYKLLSAILRLDGASVALRNHSGVTPLMCAATSKSRGGTECLRLLLHANADIRHIFANGTTLLDFMYLTLLANYFELPAQRVQMSFFLWLYGLKDRATRYFLGDTDPQEVLKKNLSEEHFATWLPNIEMGLERRRYLGSQLYEALYERLEILRHRTGPIESMHSNYAGLFMSVYLLENLIHVVTFIVCAMAFLCVLLSWSGEFASGGWRVFLGGNTAIVVYLVHVAGIMRAMAKDRDLDLENRCKSSSGILTIDLMVRDGGLLALLPACLYVSRCRQTQSWKRCLSELEWIRASLGIPGSVYGPPVLFDLRNQPLGVYWAQWKRHKAGPEVPESVEWADIQRRLIGTERSRGSQKSGDGCSAQKN
jgi:hypothetical protein